MLRCGEKSSRPHVSDDCFFWDCDKFAVRLFSAAFCRRRTRSVPQTGRSPEGSRRDGFRTVRTRSAMASGRLTAWRQRRSRQDMEVVAMHGSASGPLGALLLIAPLAAIPVFAIVGVPQFAPLAASPSDDEDFDDLGDSTTTLESRPADSPARGRSADDLFAPFPESNPRSEPSDAGRARGRQLSGPSIRGRAAAAAAVLPNADALDHWEVRPGTLEALPSRGSDEIASVAPATGTQLGDELRIPSDDLEDGRISSDEFRSDLLKPDADRPRKNAPAGERGIPRMSPGQRTESPKNGVEGPGTPSRLPELPGDAMSEQSGWQAAARRLKDLGIRKYRLESQIEEQTFTFSCTFASPDNPRIVRRFEDDADTPLEAVQKVLAQIDEWRARDVRNKVAAVGRDE